MNKTNEDYLSTFMEGIVAGDSTKKDYLAKLTKLSKEVSFGGHEKGLVDFLKTVENPNTRTNKAFSLIRLRRHFNMSVALLEELREATKSEITIHRKQKSKENIESLITYEELLAELDKLSGRDYVMNYMWVRHGLRNKDINAVVKRRKPKTITENTVIINPNAKRPKAVYYIVDYKTAAVYGDKTITITDKQFFDELRGLTLNNNAYIFSTGNGTKATVNYMNVLASKRSVNGLGEVKIAKIFLKFLLDGNQHDKIQQVAKWRFTSLGTIYTSYNIWDNK
jgi:hypothetical protein